MADYWTLGVAVVSGAAGAFGAGGVLGYLGTKRLLRKYLQIGISPPDAFSRSINLQREAANQFDATPGYVLQHLEEQQRTIDSSGNIKYDSSMLAFVIFLMHNKA